MASAWQSDKAAWELFGPGEPARNTRERLLHTAMDLFYSHGFHAIGLDRILDEVGIAKTTFYKHFESKEDLMLEVVQLRSRWELETWLKGLQERAPFDPRGQLLAALDLLDEWFNHPAFTGCMFLNAAVEFPSATDPMHRAAAEHSKREREEVLLRAKAAGASDPETFTDQYLMILSGAMVMRHASSRNDAAKVAKSAIQSLMTASFPAPPPPADQRNNARKKSIAKDS